MQLLKALTRNAFRSYQVRADTERAGALTWGVILCCLPAWFEPGQDVTHHCLRIGRCGPDEGGRTGHHADIGGPALPRPFQDECVTTVMVPVVLDYHLAAVFDLEEPSRPNGADDDLGVPQICRPVNERGVSSVVAVVVDSPLGSVHDEFGA